ncbi:glutathione S-transferase family protein [Rhodobacter sp. NTK016B]|uniref:glutathione S-transferase family protein n=1 Tax=Rhodobacter sp. NTK016B TaxID=2759676 RepID=UPI001A8FD6EE|nr:glutathione S-transferase family protein [Rhodobacter sp. NTK016B]MBN8292902.1 glutathione S-transferase family protein [Rhodobacter sp. NTK016B]
MLTLWGRRDSSNVQSVAWTLAELGLTYERHDVGHRFGGTDTPEYIAMNPNRTVPVLKDGDGPALWESAAIVRYLANRYAPEEFWPADPLARADVDRWAEWAKVNVNVPFGLSIFYPLTFLPPEKRDSDAIARAMTAIGQKLQIADARLRDRDYMMGPALTLADIHMGNLLYRYYAMDLDRPDLPALAAYYDRLSARPAYAEHVMVSFDALRPR